MTVEIGCGNCGQCFGVEPEWAGMAVQCPFCEVAVQVPHQLNTDSNPDHSTYSPSGQQNLYPQHSESASEVSESLASFQIDTGKKQKDRPSQIQLTIEDGDQQPPANDTAKSERWREPASWSDPEPPAPDEPPTQDAAVTSTNTASRPVSPQQQQSSRPTKSGSQEKQQPSTAHNQPGIPNARDRNRRRDRRQSDNQSVQTETTATESTSIQAVSGKAQKAAPKSAAKSKVPSKEQGTPSAAPSTETTGAPETTIPANEPDSNLASQSTPVTSDAGEVRPADELAPATPTRTLWQFQQHPLRFPPTMDEALTGGPVQVVVRMGIKEIQYHGEKVIVRDDQTLRNMYQIVGFVISLVILIVALAWATFWM